MKQMSQRSERYSVRNIVHNYRISLYSDGKLIKQKFPIKTDQIFDDQRWSLGERGTGGR